MITNWIHKNSPLTTSYYYYVILLISIFNNKLKFYYFYMCYLIFLDQMWNIFVHPALRNDFSFIH